MDSKTEPASEAKERIKKDAKAYSVKINCIDGTATFDYIMGATAEYNRAQEEITRLKAELEREREKQFNLPDAAVFNLQQIALADDDMVKVPGAAEKYRFIARHILELFEKSKN